MHFTFIKLCIPLAAVSHSVAPSFPSLLQDYQNCSNISILALEKGCRASEPKLLQLHYDPVAAIHGIHGLMLDTR